MIKKIIDKLFGKSGSTESGAHRVKKSPFGKRQEVTVKEHGINPQLVDERAMDVVRTHKQGGFEAFVVGGAVRDLLGACGPRTLTSPPMPRPSRSSPCFAAPSSLAGAFASCMSFTAGAASMK